MMQCMVGNKKEKIFIKKSFNQQTIYISWTAFLPLKFCLCKLQVIRNAVSTVFNSISFLVDIKILATCKNILFLKILTVPLKYVNPSFILNNVYVKIMWKNVTIFLILQNEGRSEDQKVFFIFSFVGYTDQQKEI